jgi:MFS transporter, Spinster family, sphingosine-1-phosphate transporter
LFFRSLVGVGEASFSVLAPTLIADWYPAGPERTTALGIFCVSLPLGAASGFIYAGEVSRLMGWRYAFRLSPFLSFALSSMLLLTVAEPDRGGCDRGGASTSRGGSVTKNVWSTDVVAILSSRAFTLSTLGAIGMTFTSGALAQWAPAFLQRVNCVTADEDCAASVTRTFGIVSGITGVVGTLGGAQVSKWYSKRNDAADAVVCAMGLILATPCVYAAIYLAPVYPGYPTWSAVFLGEMLVSMVWAPNTAILLSVVTPERRSNATSIYLLLTHLFGDSMSPTLIGIGADFLRTSSFFNMDKVASLQHALYLSVFSTFIASGLYMAAGTYLAPDRAKVSASTYRRLDSDAVENEGTAVENVPAPRRVYTLGPEDPKDGSSPEFEVAGD